MSSICLYGALDAGKQPIEQPLQRLDTVILLQRQPMPNSDMICVEIADCLPPESRLFVLPSAKDLPATTIYIPASYEDNDTTVFPILYLLHGIRGNHHSWAEKGQIKQVLDSLINHQYIQPLIVVMPYCFVRTREEQIHAIGNRFVDMRRQTFEQFRFATLRSYIEKTYRVATNPNLRAIAGLSSGAQQALNLADSVHGAVVGLFSPVLARRTYPNHNQNTPIYWIATGKSDFFRPETERFVKYAQKHQLTYSLYYLPGKHTWQVWNTILPIFLQQVFPYPSLILTNDQ